MTGKILPQSSTLPPVFPQILLKIIMYSYTSTHRYSQIIVSHCLHKQRQRSSRDQGVDASRLRQKRAALQVWCGRAMTAV
jgi:hypothetical protein